MAEQPEAKGRSLRGYVGIWLVLVALSVAAWVLGRQVHLGPLSLPVSLGLAVVKTVLVAVFFMHLVEQGGSMRLVLPASALYLLLLMGLSLLELMNRYGPTRPGTLRYELAPHPPAPTRTVPPAREGLPGQ